jgi:hypothetical protein
VHRAVLDNQAYIRFSRRSCVEVMAMQDIDRALREKPKRAETFEAKDAYGDEIECFVHFPGVTVEQMKALIEGPALPHTLQTMGGVKRGEPYTAKHFIAAIAPHVEALEKQYGKGIERKVWDGVRRRQVEIDLLLAENGIAEAMGVYREMARLAGARPPDAVKRRLSSSLDVILGDAKQRLDELAARVAKGEGPKVQRELGALAKALAETKLAERAAALLGAARQKK